MKNESVNLLKFVSCIIVIFLHCRFPGVIGDGIIYALRFSVPVFFMISGYFAFGKTGKWFAGKISKTCKTIVFLESLYGVAHLVLDRTVRYQEGRMLVMLIPSGWEFFRKLIFGTFFNDTLWYLYAALWTWCILAVLKKTGILGKAVYAAPVLLFLHVAGRYYCQNHYDIEKCVYIFRSSILFGLPFALLGYLFAEKKPALEKTMNRCRCFLLIAAGHVLIVAEYLLTGQYMDLHFSTIVIAAGLFLMAILNPECSKFKRLQFVGDKLSMWIYYIHGLVILITDAAGEKMGISREVFFMWVRPVWVCCISILISFLIYRIRIYRRGQGKEKDKTPA